MGMKDILSQTAHRPWPKPEGPWVMAQTWEKLLFMHWPIPLEVMTPLLPPSLPPDSFDGTAWIGVVPFRMAYVHPRLVPSLPMLSFFPELNVRTYVTLKGKAGVYFFSLEAANAIAVWLARTFFKLPYYYAQMLCKATGGGVVRYASRRIQRGAPAAHFRSSYEATGPACLSAPGSLENWLTERYILYTRDQAGAVYGGEIHHEQWPLHPAEAETETNTMTLPHGISLPDSAPLLHYVEKIRVAVWPLKKIG